MSNNEWVDDQEKVNEENRSKEYFNMVEGDNRMQLLSHCAPLAQVWTGNRYEIAKEGDKTASIKGLCWVLQDGLIKSAKLPYTVVKQIRALQTDQDWAFESFPMPRLINIKAKGAGTKEVEYTVVPSPKETKISEEVLKELAARPSPEMVVEKIKNKASGITKREYPQPTSEINPEDVPF